MQLRYANPDDPRCGAEGRTETSKALGLTLNRDLSTEGSPVNVMLNTGSPVTVVSPDFMLDALARSWPAVQGLEGWKVQVHE